MHSNWWNTGKRSCPKGQRPRKRRQTARKRTRSHSNAASAAAGAAGDTCRRRAEVVDGPSVTAVVRILVGSVVASSVGEHPVDERFEHVKNVRPLDGEYLQLVRD